MTKNLLIVESPAKAKTIEKYLGKDFKVKSSYGHIRDLDKGDIGVDIDNGFKPRYVVSSEKKKVVKELKDWVKKSDEVWLATDEDREGEAISWHLCEVLGLDDETTKRIVFREITKPAIKRAIENPRIVNKGLVNAQQARRVLDRLVGYRLSEVLWRKVKGKLSAGRVQSVAVKLIVEKEREIQQFEAEGFFRISAQLNGVDTNGRENKFKAELPERYKTQEEARAFIAAAGSADFAVASVEKKPTQRKPSAPFITSTLQQEASRKLGFGVKRTMSVAQKLYERGFITYMRTDSTNLSDTALATIAHEIGNRYGEDYATVRKYNQKKSAGAQEAHEAIRPAYIGRDIVSDDSAEQRLYDLIWKRTVASQMANAKLERTKAQISISTRPGDMLEATGEVIKFDGFLKVYTEGKDDDQESESKTVLPPLEVGQELRLVSLCGIEKFTRPPARYTEAMLVRKLEELGIGRPSTYAPTISRIMEPSRGYVTKESRSGTERNYRIVELQNGGVVVKEKTEMTGATSNRLYPSDLGMLVTDFLSEHFSEIMNYKFTAGIEEQFDTIAEGKVIWNDMITSFYGPFKSEVDGTLENAERARGRRILGAEESTGRTILAQMTRFGPVVQIGTRDEMEEEEKPKFANLRPGQSLETITLEQALELFQLPKELGSYKDLPVRVGAGRYGPYVKHGDQFISLPRGEDPLALDFDRAQELIRAKEIENMPIAEMDGKPITKGKGRFGPYLKWDGLFVNVPRKYDFDNLDLADAFALIQAKVEKEKNRYITRWEKEGIALENGRWGPFIRKGRKSISIPKIEGYKLTSEDAGKLTLDDVKKIIEGETPEILKELGTQVKSK